MQIRSWQAGGAALIALCCSAAAPARSSAPPPLFPAGNTTDTYFGTTVADPYRALEEVKNPQVQAWMKAQGE
ncbi:MAG: hypothetical protein LW835_09905, partial [Burkholderiaceae bacterium]|nr:hypothetical protein [Burkholderiaceae bacterium]